MMNKGVAHPIIDSDLDHDLRWDRRLEPAGVGTLEVESFELWWPRAKRLIDNLHPLIAEQWVHRHWKLSPYCYLPIERLKWREEHWNVASISQVWVRPSFGFDNPERDFAHFHSARFENVQPYKSLNSTGTWDFPIVVIETPAGIRSNGKIIKAAFCLIEGHQRRRFLMAWHGRAPVADNHSVFVLTLN
jgi:hypothetical protein